MSHSEIHPEFLALHSSNSFVRHNSASRSVMYQNHFSQRPGLVKYDQKLIKAGSEYELGKYINDVRVSNDSVVRGIVPRYGYMRNDGDNLHPEYDILVEYEHEVQGVTKLVLDVISCPNIRSSHTKFGFELFKTKEFENIELGALLSKDTILCKTSSLADDGSYMFGLNANIVLASHPGVCEDGAVISESFAKRIGIVVTEKRIINITKNTIPLNLYGTINQYKVFPDIGEKVKESGLLFASRKRNEFFNPADIDDEALMRTNYLFDEHTFVKPNSVVVDIKVVKGNYKKQEFPQVIGEQLDFYSYQFIGFYRSLKEQVDAIVHARKTMYSTSSAYDLSPRLHALLVEAEFYINATDVKSKIKQLYKRLPIEEYRVEIITKCITAANKGYKITDCHGGKSVICKVIADENMPKDMFGNTADLMVDDSSTISRMNIGRLYESYLGAFCRDNYKMIMSTLYQKYSVNTPHALIDLLNNDDIQYVILHLTGMYSLISNEMLDFINSLMLEQQVQHVVEVIEYGINLFYPPDNNKNSVNVINDIEKSQYKPVYGPITYKDNLNRQITTKAKVRIGVMYIMVLEKTADTYMGVSSAKLNNFGFPAKVSSSNKSRTPFALTPAKTLGETELRLWAAYMPKFVVAEMIDSVANPNTHKISIRYILEAKSPMIIPNIDRNSNPLGNSRALMILKHISNSSGFDFTFIKEVLRHA